MRMSSSIVLATPNSAVRGVRKPLAALHFVEQRAISKPFVTGVRPRSAERTLARHPPFVITKRYSVSI